MAARAAKSVENVAATLQVSLSGLPRTALPNDLRRLCGKANAENASHVAIDYKRFLPTGSAILTFPRPEFVPAAVKALNKTVLGGKTVKAFASSDVREIKRMRGAKGLLQAGERGVITGNGPDAGLTSNGKNVVLYGLPGKMVPGLLADNLRNFKLAGVEQGKPIVMKLEADKLASTSRFLVRMESVSEAYRLVRSLHMRRWRQDIFGDKYVVRASVIV